MKYPDDFIDRVICADCVAAMKEMLANSVDAIVTDPPYALGFMGKAWDTFDPTVNNGSFKVGTGTHPRGYVAHNKTAFQDFTFAWAAEALRVLKPGGHLLAFGGTRTYHRLACAIEDAGFEIRDTIAWVYASGFPKSLDVSKAIDADACREQLAAKLGRPPTRDEFKEAWKVFRQVMGTRESPSKKNAVKVGEWGYGSDDINITAPATPEAAAWEGWGTALKPAFEPVVVARKPLDGTVAENVLKWGTGGLNIDECRVGTKEMLGRCNHVNPYGSSRTWSVSKTPPQDNTHNPPSGRWPANFIHDGSAEVLGLMPESKPTKPHKVYSNTPKYEGYGTITQKRGEVVNYNETNGSAARFFYCAKASRAERNMGCEGLPNRKVNKMGSFGNQENFDCPDGAHRVGDKGSAVMRNHHPTVKPIKLMEYLVRLVTRPGAVVLDPFFGTGTTGIACINLGRHYIGIEKEVEYCEIARRRLAAARQAWQKEER